MSSPAVLGGVLYSGTSDGAFVHALDVASGNEIWRFVTEGYTWSSPAVVGDGVYIGDESGNLLALDRATGEPHWSFRTGGAVLSSPAVADGMVYFGNDDGNVYALDGEGRYPYLAVFWDAAGRPEPGWRASPPTRYRSITCQESVPSPSMESWAENETDKARRRPFERRWRSTPDT